MSKKTKAPPEAPPEAVQPKKHSPRQKYQELPSKEAPKKLPPRHQVQEPKLQESESKSPHTDISYLECSVCFEPYQDTKERKPRFLLCGHTFCTKCLSYLIVSEVSQHQAEKQKGSSSECQPMKEKAAGTPNLDESKTPADAVPSANSAKSSTKSITCPTCRSNTEIGEDGIETCKVNFALKELIWRVKPELKCDECLERDSSVWCDNCKANYCEQCNAECHVSRVSKRHKRVPLQDRGALMRCETHGEKLHYFCEDCSVTLCSVCKSDNHEMHRTPSVSKAEDKQRHKIASLQNRLRIRSEFLQEFNKRIAQSIDDSKQSQGSILDEINNTFNPTIGALQDRKAILLEDCSSKYDTSLQTLSEKRQELASEVVQLNAAVEDSKQALNRKGLDFLSSLNDLNKKMSTALKSSRKGDTPIKRTNLTFKNDKPTLVNHISRFGSLKTSPETIKSTGSVSVPLDDSKNEAEEKQASVDNDKLFGFDGNCSPGIVLSKGLRGAKCKRRNRRRIWRNATTKVFEVSSGVLNWKVNWSSRCGRFAVGVVPGEFSKNIYPAKEGYIYYTNMGNGKLYNMHQAPGDTSCPKIGGCVQVRVDMEKEKAFVEIFVEGNSVGKSRDLKLFKSNNFQFIVSMYYKGGSVSVVP